MEEIKLKPEFEAKLKELGVYEKWVFNFNNRKHEDGFNMSIDELNHCSDFNFFIHCSFRWTKTPDDEGYNLWNKISMSEIEPKSKLQQLKEWVESNDAFSKSTKVEFISKIEELEKS